MTGSFLTYSPPGSVGFDGHAIPDAVLTAQVQSVSGNGSFSFGSGAAVPGLAERWQGFFLRFTTPNVN